jgi:mitogen-activated protein kinase kinase kinase
VQQEQENHVSDSKKINSKTDSTHTDASPRPQPQHSPLQLRSPSPSSCEILSASSSSSSSSVSSTTAAAAIAAPTSTPIQTEDSGSSSSTPRSPKIRPAKLQLENMTAVSKLEVLPPRSPAQRKDLALRGRVLAQHSIHAGEHKDGEKGDKTTGLKWTRGSFLGEGAFSRVYLGLNEDTGEFLAVKELFMDSLVEFFDDDDDEDDTTEVEKKHNCNFDNDDSSKSRGNRMFKLEKEVNIMRKLQHQNIVRYLGTEFVQTPTPQFCILLEYVPGGSIASMLKQFGRFTEKIVREYTRQILNGLEYLHSNNIIHRDIKGANLLVTDQGIVKLADFGCSVKFDGMDSMRQRGKEKLLGSVPWMAPEAIRFAEEHVGRKSDIWSVGCVTIEMTTGKRPWSLYTNHLALMFFVATSDTVPQFPPDCSNSCESFLSSCLKRNPDNRKTASELLKTEKFVMVD